MDAPAAAALREALASLDSLKLQEGVKGLPPHLVAQAVALLREQANGAFKRRAYGEAIDLYTQAIAGAPDDHTLYGNRCLARLKLATEGGNKGKENGGGEGDLETALADAERAIELDPSWMKGYYRKGSVLFAMGKYREARPYLVKVASAAPGDQELQRMLGAVDAKLLLVEKHGGHQPAVPLEEEDDDGTRSVTSTVAGAGGDLTSVELPRKVYYPNQEWFARNKIAPVLQSHLKSYSDMDGPRRLIETLQDQSLVAFWLATLRHEKKQSQQPASSAGSRHRRRCLMIGSLGGVAPFQLLPADSSESEGAGTAPSITNSTSSGSEGERAGNAPSTTNSSEGECVTVLVTERSSWVARTVHGVAAKNLQLRRQGEGGGGSSNSSKIVVLRSPPLELTSLDLAGAQSMPASIPTPTGLKPDPSLLLDRVLFLDWDFSLLGTGVVKTYRRLQREGYLTPTATLSPSHYTLYAMGVQLLPQAGKSEGGDKNSEGGAAEGEGDGGDKSEGAVPVVIPPSLPSMLWEVGPSKFEMPEGAYKALTPPTPIWEGQSFLDSSPQVKEVTFDVVAPGVLHGVVYWYACEMGEGLPSLDSSAHPSIGRGISYLDPTPLTLSAPAKVTVRAYRSETQVGFWPPKEKGAAAIERGYRLPKWYPDMLLDDARNGAYAKAISRVCPGKRVLEAGSGTGLLASMLERAGAAKVLGCEIEPALAAASQEILSPKVKIFTKDVRTLDLAVPPQVIVHELFDSGLLGEGVLHLLQPIRGSAMRLLPARAKVWGQLLELRFEEIGGVNLTLLNPYRFQKDYHSSPFHPHEGEGCFARPLSDPFIVDTVDFYADTPDQKGLMLPPITTTAGGVASAIRLWHEIDFGDSADDQQPPTVLDSRETHWGYAVMYINEARLEAGERVPLMGVRLGAEYAFRLAHDALQGKLLPTPRCDMAWMSAMESLDKKTQEILTRVATTRREEASAIVRAAYRIAAHPAEFGVDPLMAARFFHSVLTAKRHAQPTR